MNQYKIYKSHRWDGEDVSWTHHAVKDGFSWPAFLVAPIWTLSKGLWGYAGLLFVLVYGSRMGARVALLTNSGGADDLSSVLLVLLVCFQVYLGFQGNQLWSAKLERDDYELLKVVQAKSSKAALAPFEKEY